SFTREVQQQQLQEQRKLEDNRRSAENEINQQNVNERRKQQQLEQSEQQQLNDLDHSEKYKIQLLRQGLQEELVLYSQQEQAKIRLAQQTRDALISAAEQVINRIQSQSTAIGSQGQTIYPGQVYYVPSAGATTYNVNA